MKTFNKNDQIIWDKIFSDVPPEWTRTETSEAMQDCLKYFQINNNQSILDLGCGIGIWSLFLSKSNFKVKGVDFSERAIQFAKNWTKSENQKISFECSPLIDHPYVNDKFDGILAAKILDNISSKELLIVKEQINNNLKDNGILYGLFNPYMTPEYVKEQNTSNHPTQGITSVNFKDQELMGLFPNFDLIEFKNYEHGFRGLIWRKLPPNLKTIV